MRPEHILNKSLVYIPIGIQKIHAKTSEKMLCFFALVLHMFLQTEWQNCNRLLIWNKKILLVLAFKLYPKKTKNCSFNTLNCFLFVSLTIIWLLFLLVFYVLCEWCNTAWRCGVHFVVSSNFVPEKQFRFFKEKYLERGAGSI